MKLRNSLVKWLWYSVRRLLLDADYEFLRNNHSKDLEIGSGREGSRGYLRPLKENARIWIYLDLEDKHKPRLGYL